MVLSHRESYIFDNCCRLCAKESEDFVPSLNTLICSKCFSWAEKSVGLGTLGIVSLEEYSQVKNAENSFIVPF